MANHPNRNQPAYRTIRGTTMDAGFRTDRGTRLRVCLVDGAVYAYDLEDGMGDTRDPSLVIDVDGQITRNGATAGYGFLPAGGEIERLAAAGFTFPDQN